MEIKITLLPIVQSHTELHFLVLGERKLLIIGEEIQMVTLTHGVHPSCGVIDTNSSGTTPAVS